MPSDTNQLPNTCHLFVRIFASLGNATFAELTAPDFLGATGTCFTCTLFAVTHNIQTVFKQLPCCLWKKVPICVGKAII